MYCNTWCVWCRGKAKISSAICSSGNAANVITRRNNFSAECTITYNTVTHALSFICDNTAYEILTVNIAFINAVDNNSIEFPCESADIVLVFITANRNAFFNLAVCNIDLVLPTGISANKARLHNFCAFFNRNIRNVDRVLCRIVYDIVLYQTVSIDSFTKKIQVAHRSLSYISQKRFSVFFNGKRLAIAINVPGKVRSFCSNRSPTFFRNLDIRRHTEIDLIARFSVCINDLFQFLQIIGIFKQERIFFRSLSIKSFNDIYPVSRNFDRCSYHFHLQSFTEF